MNTPAPGDDSLAEAFPPFGLCITHEDMTLRMLRDADLPEYLALIRGPLYEDASVPWGFPWYQVPPEERVRNALLAQWAWRGGIRPELWFLALGVYLGGRLIGCQDLTAHDFAARRVVSSGSWLTLDHQRKGLGQRMRRLLLHFAFDHLGAQRAESSVILGNEASLGVSRAVGYELNGRRIEVRSNGRQEVQYVMVTPERFRRLDGEVQVTGLTDELRTMLGAG